MFKPICEDCNGPLSIKDGLKKMCIGCGFPLSHQNRAAIIAREGLADKDKPQAKEIHSKTPPVQIDSVSCKNCDTEYIGDQIKMFDRGEACFACGADPRVEATPSGPSYQTTSKLPPPPPPPQSRIKNVDAEVNEIIQFQMSCGKYNGKTIDILLDKKYGRKNFREHYGPDLHGLDRISGAQFKIQKIGQIYSLFDLNSTNGTVVNGKLLNSENELSANLQIGARVELANHKVTMYCTAITDSPEQVIWITEETNSIKYPLRIDEETILGRDPGGNKQLHPLLYDIRAHMIQSGIESTEVSLLLQTISRQHLTVKYTVETNVTDNTPMIELVSHSNAPTVLESKAGIIKLAFGESNRSPISDLFRCTIGKLSFTVDV